MSDTSISTQTSSDAAVAGAEEVPPAATELAETALPESATDAEVAEALDQLMKSVASPAPSADNVTALTGTVNTLAESLQVMTRTIESLSQRVGPVPPVDESIAEESPVEDGTEAIDDGATDAAEEKAEGNVFLALTNGVTSSFMTLVGVGLFGAGIMQPQFGPAAIAMASLGLLGFVYASVATESKDTLPFRLIAGLLTGVGAGMLVGAIPYFGDEPARAAVFIPIGVVLLIAAHMVRLRARMAMEDYVWVAGIGVWVVIGLAIGLDKLASSVTEAPAPGAEALAPADAAHGKADSPGGAADSHAKDGAAAADAHPAPAAH